ncbi:MAG: hypothetical protein WBB15_05560 [Ornithinimicrobium sp.]
MALVGEAIARGLPKDVGLTAHDWLRMRCPWLSRANISDLVTVAEAITNPRHVSIVVVPQRSQPVAEVDPWQGNQMDTDREQPRSGKPTVLVGQRSRPKVCHLPPHHERMHPPPEAVA